MKALGHGSYDYSEGTGKRTVTFEWNGKTFCLEAVVKDDWFDLNVANAFQKETGLVLSEFN